MKPFVLLFLFFAFETPSSWASLGGDNCAITATAAAATTFALTWDNMGASGGGQYV